MVGGRVQEVRQRAREIVLRPRQSLTRGAREMRDTKHEQRFRGPCADDADRIDESRGQGGEDALALPSPVTEVAQVERVQQVQVAQVQQVQVARLRRV